MSMRAILTSLFLWLASSSLLSACAASQPRGPIVFAASSLQKPLEELASLWVEKGNDPLVLSFASSATLARQIDNGSLSDLYISADEQWIEYLVTAGRLDDSAVRVVATNSLVLAIYGEEGALLASQNVPTTRKFVTTGKIATGDPETVPLGRFAEQWLQSAGLWDAAKPHLVPAQSSGAAVKLVLIREADGGILYASDAASIKRLVAIRAIPPESHSPIVYQAVLLPSSAHPDAGDFLEFLASDEARQAFARYGFGVP